VSVLCWGRGVIRFMGRGLMSLWGVVWKRRRFASRVSEVGCAGGGDCRVSVYSLYGLGFGSDVTVVVRLDEPCH
jgi:hypothetical protein